MNVPSTTEDVNTLVKTQLVPTHVPVTMDLSCMRTNMTARKEVALITYLLRTERSLVLIGLILILPGRTVHGI
jgi:hypothetical protein